MMATLKAVRERHHRLSGNRKKGSNAGHEGHSMYGGSGGGGGGGRGKSGGSGRERGGRRGQHGRGGRNTNKDGVARPRLLVAVEAVPKPSAEVFQ